MRLSRARVYAVDMSTIQRRVGAATVLLAAAAVFTACAGNAGGGESADPVGVWGDQAATGEPSLELASDGTLTGTDGCNRLSGSWTDDDDTITFEQVASTRMFCEGVDDWLSQLATGTISGETLTVFNDRGTEIGTLERSE
jgi:heat shock protein HslJ